MTDMVSRSSSLSYSLSFIGYGRSNAGSVIDANSIASQHMSPANVNSVNDVASKLWEKAEAFGVDGGVDVDFHVEAIRCLEEKDKISFVKKVSNASVVYWWNFNAIKKEEERKGVNSFVNHGEMVEFNDFIEGLSLIDVPLKGNKFTWFNLRGKAMSRLDRFLTFEELVEEWKVDCQMVGCRDFSDLYPIWIKWNSSNWGPKPFKLFNCWIHHPKFFPFVVKVWDSLKVSR
ncbi:hypothetical protein KIW84_023869 [Lathyrus oleraceus]|uniref:Uncharacterized protein n=1 Tax=Pisum sativum TaxID=3888 RepID=A0A9D4YFB0_PEA|nr:hypothetical protein KIW84_023869 [Pisum sativum]